MPQTKLADNTLSIQERNQLVEDNMGLVYYFASKICKDSSLYDDCIQEGCLGLMRAARLFDESRHHKFSSFASFEIQCSIRDCIWNNSSYIRYPDAERKAINDYNSKVRKLESELGEMHSNDKETLAKESGISDYTYKRMTAGSVSLNSTVDQSDGDTAEFGNLVKSETDIENEYIDRESYDNLVQLMTQFFEEEVAKGSADPNMQMYIKERLDNFIKSAQGVPFVPALEQMRKFHPELCPTDSDSKEVKQQKAKDLDRIYCKVSSCWMSGLKRFKENLQMVEMLNNLREEIM